MKTNKTNKIVPFLWFDDKAEEAINFYTSVFTNSKILSFKKWPDNAEMVPPNCKPSTVKLASFQLEDTLFHAFDAGPMFTFNPSISFFVICDAEEEATAIYGRFIEEGEALMPLDKYAWSDCYGWVKDKFGISWQIMKSSVKEVGQKIVPSFLFSGKQCGHAEEAMNLYSSFFKDSEVDSVSRYEAGDPTPEGYIKHAQFRLGTQVFKVMDNGMDVDIPFTEAISLFVHCKDQDEVDFFWNNLTEEGEESRCGWLKDKFGVSWQIVPEFISEKVANGEPERIGKMMMALGGMTKLDVAELEKAYNS